MKKIYYLLMIVVFLMSAVAVRPAQAVESGADASGNEFVVPILFKVNANSYGSCSGALIAPTVVVTAGHCAVDENGLVTNNIYVGKSGESMANVSPQDIIKSVSITSTYTTGANATVGNDDLAFLVLSKPQPVKIPIRLASESEVSSFKSSGTSLKGFGYGCYSDACTEDRTYPKSFIGTFSSVQAVYSNSAYMQSTNGHACSGDSGGPIVATTPSSLILVGITTGVTKVTNCAKRQYDGTYYALFTLISRYANLAFGSASQSITDLNSQVNDLQSKFNEAESSVANLQSTNTKLNAQISNLSSSLDDAQNQIDSLEAEVQSLRDKLPSTITCVKGKSSKKVTAVKPKCPTGYSQKS